MLSPFGELVTAIITPFADSGALNLKKAGELAHYLVENGSDALVVCGTTGESPTLSDDEKVEIFTAVAEAVRGKAKVIAGTGSNDTAKSIRLTRKAQDCGADGIMLVAPYYNKPSQEALYQHFSAIAAVTTLPVLLYNVPGRTGVNISADTTLRLAAVSNIVAVKEASGDLEQISRISATMPPDFYIYSGDDVLTLPILAVGGTGVVSVASHIAGPQIKEMIQSFKSGRHNRARQLHLKLLPLFKALFVTSNPVPVKGAMNLLGHGLGPVRPPLLELGGSEQDIIEKVLKEMSYL